MIRYWLPLALIVIGSLRIGSTWRVFTQVFDEAFHLGCSIEWWELKAYTRERHTPPLARIAMGALPYLVGNRHDVEAVDENRRGNLILGTGESYVAGLALARAGILPFFWIFCIAVWRWTVFRVSPEAGLGAVFVASMLPPVLGHAGFATTDMAVTAMLAAFGWQFDVWLRERRWTNALAAGLMLGLALAAKLTAVGVAPVMALILWLFHRAISRRLILQCLAGLIVALIALSSTYRFKKEFDRPREELNASLWGRAIGLTSFFKPYIDGVQAVRAHNDTGHYSFLLGRGMRTGDWRFLPVAFFFKTPIPVLILLALALLRREARWAWCLGAVSMLMLMPSNVNLGIRHGLMLYIAAAVAAGIALAQLWVTRRWAAAALAAWLTWNTVQAYPDHAFWFNEFAGKHPERILAESDLDWGQDLHRAVAALDRRGIAKCRISYFGSTDWKALFPGRFEEFWWPDEQPGCTLVSVRGQSLDAAFSIQAGNRPELEWLDKYEPTERIGRSMRLYLIDKVH